MKKQIKKGECTIDITGKETSGGFKMSMKARGNCKRVMGEEINDLKMNFNMDD